MKKVLIVEDEILARLGLRQEKLTKVTLNEVAHSIFYAPQFWNFTRSAAEAGRGL